LEEVWVAVRLGEDQVERVIRERCATLERWDCDRFPSVISIERTDFGEVKEP